MYWLADIMTELLVYLLSHARQYEFFFFVPITMHKKKLPWTIKFKLLEGLNYLNCYASLHMNLSVIARVHVYVEYIFCAYVCESFYSPISVQASDPKNQSGCNRNIKNLMQYVDKMLTLWARGHRSKHPLGRNVSMLVDMARINVCGLPLYLLVIQQSGHSVQHHNTRHKTHIWFTKADLMHLHFLPFCPFTVLSYL